MATIDELIGKDIELWGVVPSLLDEGDARSAQEQIVAKHGGAWKRRLDFRLDQKTMVLNPDSTPLPPQSLLLFRGEKLFLYADSWVLIMRPNGSWQVGRMV